MNNIPTMIRIIKKELGGIGMLCSSREGSGCFTFRVIRGECKHVFMAFMSGDSSSDAAIEMEKVYRLQHLFGLIHQMKDAWSKGHEIEHFVIKSKDKRVAMVTVYEHEDWPVLTWDEIMGMKVTSGGKTYEPQKEGV